MRFLRTVILNISNICRYKLVLDINWMKVFIYKHGLL